VVLRLALGEKGFHFTKSAQTVLLRLRIMGGHREQTRTGQRARLPRWKAKTRRFLRQKVLGVGDTPHRIAWGVFLGFFVAFTPTLGFQIIVYLLVASLLRANKVSGIPWLFISNPFSALPVYYSTWWVGNLIISGGGDSAGGGREAVQNLADATTQVKGSFSQFFDPKYWATVGDTLVTLGYELWLGGFVLGMVTGTIAYPIAFRAVIRYRERVEQKRLLFENQRQARGFE